MKKQRRIKKAIGLLGVCLTLSIGTTAFASDEGAYEPPGWQNCPEPHVWTMEEISAMSDEMLQQLELLPVGFRSRSVEYSYMIYRYNIKQKETYYCGPAATLQVIMSAGTGDNVAGDTYDEKQVTLAGNDYLCTDRDHATWINYIPSTLDTFIPRNRKWAKMTVNPEITSTLNSFQYHLRTNLDYGYGAVVLMIPGELHYYNGEDTGHYLSCSGIVYTTMSENDYDNITVRLDDPHYDDRYFGTHTLNIVDVAKCMYKYSETRGPANFVF